MGQQCGIQLIQVQAAHSNMHTSIHQVNTLNDTDHLLKTPYHCHPLHFVAFIANLHEILPLIFQLPQISALGSHQFISYQPTDLRLHYNAP